MMSRKCCAPCSIASSTPSHDSGGWRRLAGKSFLRDLVIPHALAEVGLEREDEGELAGGSQFRMRTHVRFVRRIVAQHAHGRGVLAVVGFEELLLHDGTSTRDAARRRKRLAAMMPPRNPKKCALHEMPARGIAEENSIAP